MHDELTDIRNQQYENAVRQRENLEMAVRLQETFLGNSNEHRDAKPSGMGRDSKRTRGGSLPSEPN